jgi:hypothetical protein
MDELKLDDYPGEYVTACAAFAQKQFKVIQSGYAPPFRSGSKLLLKLCNTECEQFNRQAYAMLDLVKKFERNFEIADPKSVTAHVDYCRYGPIPLIAWLQKETHGLFHGPRVACIGFEVATKQQCDKEHQWSWSKQGGNLSLLCVSQSWTYSAPLPSED